MFVSEDPGNTGVIASNVWSLLPGLEVRESGPTAKGLRSPSRVGMISEVMEGDPGVYF